jgi:hypothetical protein
MRVVSANPVNKFFKASAIALILTVSASATYAAVNPDPGIKNAVINHVATTNDNLLFEVRVANESGERFTILIKDNTGTTLYRGVYTDKNFAKKFQFPKSESDKIVFIVKNASGNKTESFEINSNTRMVEEVVVKRVN